MGQNAALARMLNRSVDCRPVTGPTEQPPLVRIGLQADEQAIFDMLMLLAPENAMAPVNSEKVWDTIKKGTRRDGGVVGIIEVDGKIAATVGIGMGPWWYSSAWHCEEMWCYVHPDYRKAKDNYAELLIQFTKWWSEQLGMPVLMGVLTTNRTLGKVRLYARHIPFVGGLFLWRGTNV